MNLFYVALTIWIGTLVIAAISDLRSFRISNILPSILILLFVVMQFMDSRAIVPWENIVHFGITLIVGLFLWIVGSVQERKYRRGEVR